MPDLVTHCFFAEKVYENLEKSIKQKIENKDLYMFAAVGPDSFFFYKFIKGKKNAPIKAIGDYMHNNDTDLFFNELIKQTLKSKNKDILFSYLTGFINHYAADSFIHPYVFYKTGNYIINDENKFKYRGLHMRLERAIDAYFIRNYYYKNPNTIRIWKNFLKLRMLPKEIEEDLNNVYFNAYQHKNIYNVLNKCVKYQRKFYKFIYDPLGIKNFVFNKIDNDKSVISYKYISYFNKEIKNIDILNTKNSVWNNPVDNSPSNKNVLQLITDATQFATEAINAVYQYIYLHKDVNLKSYFNNRSYLTGLVCNPNDEMIYFNDIFSDISNKKM